jgi:hypothetical protein
MNVYSSSKISDFAFDAQRGKIKSVYSALRLFCNFSAYELIQLAWQQVQQSSFFLICQKIASWSRDEINEGRER